MKKEFSIVIGLKNRTLIYENYEPLELKTFQRHKIYLSGMKREIELKKGKIKLSLLLNFLESLEKIKLEDETFEIVLVDFGSTDYDLNKLPFEYPSLEFNIVKVDDYFSRGVAMNTGYKNSNKHNIFFADADMYMTSRKLFDDAYNIIAQDKIFFPICNDLCDPTWQIVYPRISGYGLCMVSKKMFKKSGYSWHQLGATGLEDNMIWDYFNKQNLCVRYLVDGYYHQWHPTNPSFKNMHYKHSDITKKKICVNCTDLNKVMSDSNLMKKIQNKINDDPENVYFVNNLEKYVSTVISLDDEDPKLTDEEITNFKNSFNKKVDILKL